MIDLTNDVVIQQLNNEIVNFLSTICDIAESNNIDKIVLLTLVDKVISDVTFMLIEDIKNKGDSYGQEA